MEVILQIFSKLNELLKVISNQIQDTNRKKSLCFDFSLT